jgi:hypothetical protein
MPDKRHISTMTVLAFAVFTVGAGCKSTTEPPIPADWFTFNVQNRIDQYGPDSTADENVAELFQVHVGTGTTATKLAEIQRMDVVWPGASLRTSIPNKFQSESGVYNAVGVERRGAGLMAGDYTLEVEFNGGQTVRRHVDYDGHVLGRPIVQSLTPSANGVELTWDAPVQAHSWRLFLVQDTDQVAYTSPKGTPGGAVTGSITYSLSSGTSYTLELFMYDDFNQRMVYIPFDYTAP